MKKPTHTTQKPSWPKYGITIAAIVIIAAMISCTIGGSSDANYDATRVALEAQMTIMAGQSSQNTQLTAVAEQADQVVQDSQATLIAQQATQLVEQATQMANQPRLNRPIRSPNHLPQPLKNLHPNQASATNK
jgi:hypothetical protein